MVKSNTWAVDVPLAVTDAADPGAPVVVVPAVTVGRTRLVAAWPAARPTEMRLTSVSVAGASKVKPAMVPRRPLAYTTFENETE